MICVSTLAQRRGATMIELMVVCSIVVIAAVGLSVGLIKLCNIEDETRDKAFIRERMCRMLSQYVDCICMAKTVNTNADWLEISYRTETNGVSFETNFMKKVITSRLSLTNLYYSPMFDDKMLTGVDLRFESEDAKYLNRPRHLQLDAESEIHQHFRSALKNRFGNCADFLPLKIQVLNDSVIKLTLSAKYPRQSKVNGIKIREDEVIEVSRIARLWNHQ